MLQNKTRIVLMVDNSMVQNTYSNLLRQNGFKIIKTKPAPAPADQIHNLAEISETEFDLLIWVNFEPAVNYANVAIIARKCREHQLPFIFINHAFLDPDQKNYIKHAKKSSYFHYVPCYYSVKRRLKVIRRASRK